MNDKINTLKKWIFESNHIVFFCVVGVSSDFNGNLNLSFIKSLKKSLIFSL